MDPYGIHGTFPPEFSRVCLSAALVNSVSVALLFDLSMSGVLQQELLQRRRLLPIAVIVALLADLSFTICDGSPGRVGVACHTGAHVYVGVVLGLGGCAGLAHTIPAWRRVMSSAIVVYPAPSSETVEASDRSSSLRADTSVSQAAMLPPLRLVRSTHSEAAVAPWNDAGGQSPPISLTDAAVSPLSRSENALASRSASAAITTELMMSPQSTTQINATELVMSPRLATHVQVVHVAECNQSDVPGPLTAGVVKSSTESKPGCSSCGGIRFPSTPTEAQATCLCPASRLERGSDNGQCRYVVSDGGSLSSSAGVGSAKTQFRALQHHPLIF